jgi:radical SAM superfamily enzyme YgiQ (UPF0313 family)
MNTNARMNIVLINPYELGRQPFGLAEPTAWLRDADCEVSCLDLSIQRLDSGLLAQADLVGIYVAMHTATRIAFEALPRIREMAPNAHICAFGLYAPMNEKLFRKSGVNTVLGGEVEPGLLSLMNRLRSGKAEVQTEPLINLSKIEFFVPDRSGLPGLAKYAQLNMPENGRKITGFVETTRGCKHLCRHCPVVPIYKGTFRVIPLQVVMEDIRNQVTVGAEHISFGDPDFLNGPKHALRVVQAMHREFPAITYDATIKIQHIIEFPELLHILKSTGCLFITSAVEAVDNQILRYLQKNHNDEDFHQAVALCRQAGIALAPTFVAFTPWTTLPGYIQLLQRLVDLKLVQSVPPIQLAIRLLVPEGSYLLKLSGFRELVEDFDENLLGYPWKHQDPRVDSLQQAIQEWVAKAEMEGQDRLAIFQEIWRMAYAVLGRPAPILPSGNLGSPIPCLSEAWYCCAEPTNQQLEGF